MDQLETDDEAFAEAEVRRSDDAHAARMHAQFGVTWGDPLLYDLVLNTDRVSVESCVAQIQQLAARPEFQETAAVAGDAGRPGAERARARRAEGPRIDPRRQHRHRSARTARWCCSGIVLNAQESAEAARVASTVAGVGNVDNQLRLMAITRRFAYAKT